MPRRRITPKPRPKPAPEPVDQRREARYHTYNLMREDGAMPHDAGGDDFTEYLILNGMTEEGYWLNVNAGETMAADIEKNGMPIPTDKLTNDQKGWAKADHFEHFRKEDTARWRPIPGKDSKVKPYRPVPRVHDRLYNSECTCATVGLTDDDTMNDGVKIVAPKLELWGYRWDMRELLQCQNCGEVIARSPYPNKNTNGDGNDENGE